MELAQVRRFFCHLTHTLQRRELRSRKKFFRPTYNNLGSQGFRRERTEDVLTGCSFFVIFRECDALARPSPPSKIASDRDNNLGAHLDDG